MPAPRIALVTGGNRGLGFEACRQLAQQGCHILLGARDTAKGEAAVSTLRDEGHNVASLVLDMAEPASIDSAVDHIRSKMGRLDILINNAAILTDLNQQPTQVADVTLRNNFEVNFFGPWHLTRALAPLLTAGSGRVLNMATQVATLAQLSDPESPLKNDICPAYQASKIALNAMTALFAKELGLSDVKINSVCPGWVLTDMGHGDLPDYGAAARPLSPLEAVAAYLWLVADDPEVPTGGFFTGRNRVAW